MTEGRLPKGEPEPPDTGSESTATVAQKHTLETAEEPEVRAYQEPESEMGEPEPPDADTSGT